MEWNHSTRKIWSGVCVCVCIYVLNFCHLDPELSETSRSEPGWKDELRRGPAPSPDAQHRPE